MRGIVGDQARDHFGSRFAQHLSGLPRGAADACFRKIETSVGCLKALQVKGICLDILTIEFIDAFSTPAERALYRTFESSTGIVAYGSSLAQRGDELWILDGCRVPMILRADSSHEH